MRGGAIPIAFTVVFTIFVAVVQVTGFRLQAAEKVAAPKADDVFVDEGDSDFEAIPVAKEPEESRSVEASAPVVDEPAVAASAEDQTDSVSVAAPDLASGESKEKSIDKPKRKKSAAPKKVVEKKAKRAVANSASSESGAKSLASGIYVVTKERCPMSREPASESPVVLTVKAEKKIWVEEVDGQWVRAFNKAGEPGYIQRDCVK